MQPYDVGLDVHSQQSVFGVAEGAGTVGAEGEVPTTPAGLKEWRARYALSPGTPVALETGTTAFFVARQLSAVGMAPVVIDAHEVRLKAHRPTQKSDRRDARELCEGVRRDIDRVIVHVPSAAVARGRDTLSRHRHFVRVQTAEINAAKRLLRSAGRGRASRDLRSERGWATVVQVVEPSGELRAYREPHRAVWRCAGEQIQAFAEWLAAHQRPFVADLQRLQATPRRRADRGRDGGGRLRRCPARSRCEARGQLRRRDPGDRSIGVAGCAWADHQTGAAERRAMRCEAAHHAARPPHPLHHYFAPPCATHGDQRAVVAGAHRLCRIMFAMLRHGRDFDVSRVGIEVGPFEHTSVTLYRLKPSPRRSGLRPVEQRA